EQSQIWGSFRIANRIKNVKRIHFVHNNIQFYCGAYTTHYGAIHKRYFGYIDETKMIIIDYVNAKTGSLVKSYIHLIPMTNLENKGNGIFASFNNLKLKIIPFGTKEITHEQGWYSERFNVKEINPVLSLEKDKAGEFFGFLIDHGSISTNV